MHVLLVGGRGQLGQAIQRCDSLRNDVLVRRKVVVGQGFPVRQVQDLVLPAAVELDRCLQLVGVGEIVNHQHHRARAVVIRGFDGGQCQRAAVEAGPGFVIGFAGW